MITKSKKQQTVKDIRDKLSRYSTVAVASISGLKSRQFNAIKKKLRGQVEIVVARKTLIQRAIASARKEVAELEKQMPGAEVLILSDIDAFKLFKLFKQNKTKTFAKAGVTAPEDIIVPAGETNLTPGPVLTELKQAKIQAKIQGPKIMITSDAVVAKAGQPISENVAAILTKLGIEPLQVGIEVKAVFENGTIYPGEILNVDEAHTLQELINCNQKAVNLCVYAEIFNSVSINLLLAKAAREAKALMPMAEKPQVEEKKEEAVPSTAEEKKTEKTETPAEAQTPPEQREEIGKNKE